MTLMHQGCADPSFGLQSRPLAILQLLAQMPPDFAPWDEEHKHFDVNIQTYPWYNGRERGFCLEMFPKYGEIEGPCLCITVVENNPGEVSVQSWEQLEASFNQPTLQERQAAAGEVEPGDYITWDCYPSQQLHLVVPKIFELMYQWYHHKDNR